MTATPCALPLPRYCECYTLAQISSLSIDQISTSFTYSNGTLLTILVYFDFPLYTSDLILLVL